MENKVQAELIWRQEKSTRLYFTPQIWKLFDLADNFGDQDS